MLLPVSGPALPSNPVTPGSLGHGRWRAVRRQSSPRQPVPPMWPQRTLDNRPAAYTSVMSRVRCTGPTRRYPPRSPAPAARRTRAPALGRPRRGGRDTRPARRCRRRATRPVRGPCPDQHPGVLGRAGHGQPLAAPCPGRAGGRGRRHRRHVRDAGSTSGARGMTPASSRSTTSVSERPRAHSRLTVTAASAAPSRTSAMRQESLRSQHGGALPPACSSAASGPTSRDGSGPSAPAANTVCCP
jgi:hypothetical protein